MTMQKLFQQGSSLSSVASTTPPKTMSKSELKYHIATKPYRCMICSMNVYKTYHIHKTIHVNEAKKRESYAIHG
jgi:hypothetical protein